MITGGLPRVAAVLLGAAFCLLPARAQEALTLVPAGTDWRYLDDGSDQGTAWRGTGFDDSSWNSGPAQLGYGDGDEATVVAFGPDPANKYVTTYFRHAFELLDPTTVASLDLGVVRDDGCVVYLNGQEVFRTNMPSFPIGYTTLASIAIAGSNETDFFYTTVDPALLVAGTNVIAVEVHQADVVSSDISFDLRLTGTPGNRITRGPYLQQPTPDGMIVRWRTALPGDSRVRFGAAPGDLVQVVDDATPTTEHEVALIGLQANGTYYYSVGSSTETFAGGDAATLFVTPPAVGQARPTRIWVIGDSGAANPDARAVRDAYLNFTGARYTDLWLMLGDNAYNDGTDANYQAAVFDTYPSLLRQTAVWPTVGNHDVASQSTMQTGPYYDIFTLPASGAAGGVASGTEAYYSFDYGNIHFVVLNSHDINRSPGAPMWTWLELDLADTVQDWIIAFWHHPPYSRGSHDSDNPSGFDSNLAQMRERALPLLESLGVDLVLTGHSHSYERSFLLDGHYGPSTTLTGAMILDGGSGSWVADGAYRKPGAGPNGHEGAVYVVAGNASLLAGGPLDHPAMFASMNRLGSVVLDVDGDRLEALFLDSRGAVADRFTIAKGAAPTCSAETLLPAGSAWNFLNDGTAPGAGWSAPGFDDSAWSTGPAELGYGDGDEATVVGFGGDPANKPITTYFRREFEVAEVGDISALDLGLRRDDGAVVYLNGSEIFRSNMPYGPVTGATPAAATIGGLDEIEFFRTAVAASLLAEGTNLLAAEVHQVNASSSDMSFELTLVADRCVPPVTPDFIFRDDFEGGNLSAWSSSRTDGGDLAVTAAAALEGQFGLQASIDDRNALWVQDDAPQAERRYNVRFRLDPNGLTMPQNKPFNLFRGASPTSNRALLQLTLRYKSGRYEARAGALQDGGGTTFTTWVPLADQPAVIEMHWSAATAPGAGDGSVSLWIDGVLQASRGGIDNDEQAIHDVRFGAVSGIPAGVAGVLLLDAFESWR